MAELVRLPRLGANVAEGTVGVWHVGEGETVQPGDPLVEIITSKATFDVESPAGGALLKVCAPAKSNVPVAYILCVVGAADEAMPDVTAENERLMFEFREAVVGEKAAAGDRGRAGIRATPGGRRLAKAENVDLGDVPPGPGSNVIREEDVRRFLRYRRKDGEANSEW